MRTTFNLCCTVIAIGMFLILFSATCLFTPLGPIAEFFGLAAVGEFNGVQQRFWQMHPLMLAIYLIPFEFVFCLLLTALIWAPVFVIGNYFWPKRQRRPSPYTTVSAPTPLPRPRPSPDAITRRRSRLPPP